MNNHETQSNDYQEEEAGQHNFSRLFDCVWLCVDYFNLFWLCFMFDECCFFSANFDEGLDLLFDLAACLLFVWFVIDVYFVHI